VTVHGQAQLLDVLDPAEGNLRQAMLDYYLSKQGPNFEIWLNEADPIETHMILTFQSEE